MATFWNDPLPPEAKRVYRWLVYMGGIEPFLAKKVTQPSYTMTETKHNYLNHTFYYPGRIEWQTIDVTFVDPAKPDTGSRLISILQKSGYQLPESEAVQETLSKHAAVGALGNISIQSIDSLGKVVQEWQLINPFLKDMKFSELTYDADDMVEVTATIRYDYVKYGSKLGGVNPWGGTGQSATK